MDGIPDYCDSDEHNRELHGLEVGDIVSGGIGGDVEVVEIDDVGVKFDDGQTASHLTVVSNLQDLGML